MRLTADDDIFVALCQRQDLRDLHRCNRVPERAKNVTLSTLNFDKSTEPAAEQGTQEAAAAHARDVASKEVIVDVLLLVDQHFRLHRDALARDRRRPEHVHGAATRPNEAARRFQFTRATYIAAEA
jgi:hypothetical protein